MTTRHGTSAVPGTSPAGRWARRASVLAVAALVVAAGCSSKGSTDGGVETAALAVTNARIPVPASPDVAAVYLDVVNNTDEADTLESVTTDAGGTAEVHETTDDNGTMKMSASGPVDIAAGATLALKPGGYHIMIMKPTRTLAEGESVAVTLHFTRAGAVKVDAEVVDPASVMEGGAGSGHDGDMSDMSGDH